MIFKVSLWFSLWIKVIEFSHFFLWFFIIFIRLLTSEIRSFCIFLLIIWTFAFWFFRKRWTHRTRTRTCWSLTLRNWRVNPNLLTSQTLFFGFLHSITIISYNNKLLKIHSINISTSLCSQMNNRILIFTHQINNRNDMMTIFLIFRTYRWRIFKIFTFKF